MGLIVGLLKPGVHFLGYEFAPHRVEVANASVQLMGLGQDVEFFTQDLSVRSFQIPSADIYYLYDPFCEETYRFVLAQLIEISRSQPIVIATKGNARLWLREIALREGWASVEDVNGDNLCLYYSSQSTLNLDHR